MTSKSLLSLAAVAALASGALPASAATTPTVDAEQMQQIRELYQSGQVDQARSLADSLGLQPGRGMRFGGPFAKMSADEIAAQKAEMDAHRATVDAAIEAGDYDAWAAAMADAPHGKFMTEKITAENFGKFAEMHRLQTQARAIADELGLGAPRGDLPGGPGMGGEKMSGKMRGGMMGGESGDRPARGEKRGFFERIFGREDAE